VAELILASRSPQRRALLALLGVPFRVVASSFEEHGPGRSPLQRVRENALGKARDVATRAGIPPGGAVLGSDTEVVLDGRSLGKPTDREAADAMLRALSGREHVVMTAVVLLADAGERTEVSETAVRVRRLGGGLREWYLDTGEWRDRAGGYAVQGAGGVLVEGLRGDHATVVGLPVALVGRMLEDAGLAPWAASAGSR
jgi:septum formation protein